MVLVAGASVDGRAGIDAVPDRHAARIGAEAPVAAAAARAGAICLKGGAVAKHVPAA
jgi:hypothetical protein